MSGIVTATTCLLRGQRSARFYLAAWALYCVGSVFAALRQHARSPVHAYLFSGSTGSNVGDAVVAFAAPRSNYFSNSASFAFTALPQMS